MATLFLLNVTPRRNHFALDAASIALIDGVFGIEPELSWICCNRTNETIDYETIATIRVKTGLLS